MPAPTFEQSLALSGELLKQISCHSIADGDAGAKIEDLISTVASARGFFVSILTGDSAIADQPPQFLILALEKHKEIVADLLTKNVVMATTMKSVHERNNDEQAARGSQKVVARSSNLLGRLNRALTSTYIAKMQAALLASFSPSETAEENNEYLGFLARWKYDEEQRRLALQAIETLAGRLAQ